MQIETLQHKTRSLRGPISLLSQPFSIPLKKVLYWMLWIRKIVQWGGEEKGRSLLETQMSSFYVDDIDFSAANSSLHSHNELIFLCEESTQHFQSKDILLGLWVGSQRNGLTLKLAVKKSKLKLQGIADHWSRQLNCSVYLLHLNNV